jgi:hypothetical protein
MGEFMPQCMNARGSNDGALFFQQKKWRVGAQTIFCGDKKLVEGESLHPDNTNHLFKSFYITYSLLYLYAARD